MIELLTVFLLVAPTSQTAYTVYGQYYHQDLCGEIAASVNEESAQKVSCVELNFVVEMPNTEELADEERNKTGV